MPSGCDESSTWLIGGCLIGLGAKRLSMQAVSIALALLILSLILTFPPVDDLF
jgi:hypothetical protein